MLQVAWEIQNSSGYYPPKELSLDLLFIRILDPITVTCPDTVKNLIRIRITKAGNHSVVFSHSSKAMPALRAGLLQ
jgi:hypothetical protein